MRVRVTLLFRVFPLLKESASTQLGFVMYVGNYHFHGIIDRGRESDSFNSTRTHAQLWKNKRVLFPSQKAHDVPFLTPF